MWWTCISFFSFLLYRGSAGFLLCHSATVNIISSSKFTSSTTLQLFRISCDLQYEKVLRFSFFLGHQSNLYHGIKSLLVKCFQFLKKATRVEFLLHDEKAFAKSLRWWVVPLIDVIKTISLKVFDIAGCMLSETAVILLKVSWFAFCKVRFSYKEINFEW